jgi:hypothetical protein
LAVPVRQKGRPTQGYTHKIVLHQVPYRFLVQGLTRTFLQGYGVCADPSCVLLEEMGTRVNGSIVICDKVVAHVRLPEGADITCLPAELLVLGQTLRIKVSTAPVFTHDPCVQPVTPPTAGVAPAPHTSPPASSAGGTMPVQTDASPPAPTSPTPDPNHAGAGGMAQPAGAPSTSSPQDANGRPSAARVSAQQAPRGVADSDLPRHDRPAVRQRVASTSQPSPSVVPQSATVQQLRPRRTAASQAPAPSTGRRPRQSSASSDVDAPPPARRRTAAKAATADSDDYGASTSGRPSIEVQTARLSFSQRLGATSASWTQAIRNHRTGARGGKVMCIHPDWPLTATFHDALQEYAPDLAIASSLPERLEFLNFFFGAFRDVYGLDGLSNTNRVSDLPAPLLQELHSRITEMQLLFDQLTSTDVGRRTRLQHRQATAGPSAPSGRPVVG